jgi:uncharacterized Zn-finger protein
MQTMTDEVVPHFHNEPGVPVIEIGAKKFMCIGALPPQDHPHVFCDMGEDLEYVCPYCSTLIATTQRWRPTKPARRNANCTTVDHLILCVSNAKRLCLRELRSNNSEPIPHRLLKLSGSKRSAPTTIFGGPSLALWLL